MLLRLVHAMQRFFLTPSLVCLILYPLCLAVSLGACGTVGPQDFAPPAAVNTPTLASPSISNASLLQSPSPLSGNTSSASTQTLTQRWLQSVQCAAPCWEGITPGKTTADEAMTFLQDNPLITQAERQPMALGMGNKIFWDGADMEVFALYNSNPKELHLFPVDTLYEVRLLFKSPTHLGHILSAFGSPSFTEAKHFPPGFNAVDEHFTVSALFPNKGMVVQADSASLPTINADLAIDTVSLFPLTADGLKIVPLGLWSGKNAVPWHGYGTFASYCADSPLPCA